MISPKKSYPKYKDSQTDWMGLIPEHWQVRRFKYLLKERDSRSATGKEQLLRVSQYTGVTERKNISDLDAPDTRAKTLVGYKKVEINDLVINIMLAWNGSLGVSRYSGIASPAYCVYSFNRSLNPHYFHYLLRSSVYKKRIKALSTGVVESRLRLYSDNLFGMESFLPPIDEQNAIVTFLDYSNAKIDKVIRAKSKLIKLLQEQKTVIINEVVTKGVSSQHSLKSTGIGWLGSVPKNWDVTALRNRYFQHLGKMLDSKRLTGKHSLPYLRNTDVQWNLIRTNDLPVMDISPNEYERYTVKKGDLLVCEGGEVGRCAIWNGQISVCGFQKALHRLRPRSLKKDSPKYLLYVLWAAAKAGAFNDGHVSTIAHLTGDKLRAHRFPFPPIEEQELIVKKIEKDCDKIDSTIEKELEFISLLNEMKNRITTDVVTGKLDVQAASKIIDFEITTEDVAPEFDEMEPEIMEELNEN